MPERFRNPILILAILSALVPCGCGQRMAGTTSTAENTVTGVALLPDGRPASGASVSARSSVVVMSRNLVPTSRLISYVSADSKGHFLLPRPDDEGFYLEIRTRGAADSSAISWYREFPAASPVQLPLGEFSLDSSIEIRGTLTAAKGGWTTRAWVGIPGTDLFRAVSPGPDGMRGAFSLPGAPASARSVVVYLEPESQVQQDNIPLPVDSIAISVPGPGKVRDAGELIFHVGVR